MDAKIKDNDDLVLEGYDIGKLVEERLGDPDYEYWLTVEKQHKDEVLLNPIKKDSFGSDVNFREWLNEPGYRADSLAGL